MYTKHIVPIISYGKYARVFINFLSESSYNSDILCYFRILKKRWHLKSEELLTEIDSALEMCQNQGIYYLLLSNKLEVLRALDHALLTQQVYEILKKEYHKIPIPYRVIIGQSLDMTTSSYTQNNLTKFRSWSDLHREDEVDIAVSLKAKARAFLKRGEVKRASKIFLEASEHASKYPHPTSIVSGFNNASWYLRKEDLETSYQIAKQLAWHCGYWFDDPVVLMNYLDTILVIAVMAKAYKFFLSTAEMLCNYYKKLRIIEPACEKEYHDSIQLAKKHFKIAFIKGNRTDEVANSKGLQTFLNERIKIPRRFSRFHGLSHTSLFRILKGDMKFVKVETLKGTFTALDVSFSFKNPKVVNHILSLMNEKDYFQKHWQRINRFSAFKVKSLFLKSFMTNVVLNEINLSEWFDLTDSDRKKLNEFIRKDVARIAFFNRAFQLAFDDDTIHPFYKARYTLVNQLFSEMGAMRHITLLMRLYSSIKSAEKLEQLNVYFRQYVRYSTTPWRFDVEDVLSERFSDPDYAKISRFCKKINVSEMFGYLCTWEFEGEERESFLKVLLS